MNELPQRKHIRLEQYDYSQGGCYYITVSISSGQPVLSYVGRGLAPAEPCRLELSELGKLVEAQLLNLEKRFDFVFVDQYVIMPTHVHAIIRFAEQAAGASPRPTLSSVIGVWKSLTTRLWNAQNFTPGKKLFQTSFYEHIVRNADDYAEIWCYIENNPAKWLETKKD